MNSIILRTAMHLIVPLVLVFSAYIALKGHNEPGGGFIGGLVASVILVLFHLCEGSQAIERMIPFHPRIILFTGLTMALATAIAPLLMGLPLLTSYINHHVPVAAGAEMEFASAMIFDIGVFLVVVGVSLGIITRFSQEVEK